MSVIPYLMFDGRAEEAAEFYKQALGAEVPYMARFSESPEPASDSGEGCVGGPPPDPNKIMHMSLKIGGSEIFASDGECKGQANFAGISLAHSLSTPEEAQQAFDRLSEGGQVQMPMTPTFWSPLFGMVADKFGVSWMIMAEGKMPN